MISATIEAAEIKFEEWLETDKKANQLMEFLEITTIDNNYINKIDLFNILMDKEKCQKLISKLKNKAFW